MKKILIAGVPYGKDNAGDEAILAATVSLIRRVGNDPEIIVSTGDQESTRKKFNVKTAPLFGFPPKRNLLGFIRTILKSDIFVWGGATGLSDYPRESLKLVKIARFFKKRVILYSVGMNSELNPYIYRFQEGKKTRVLRVLEKFLPANIDLVGICDRHARKSVYRDIKRTLDNVDMITVRDPESKAMLERIGVAKEVIVAADPAILTRPVCTDRTAKELEKDFWKRSSGPIIGVCISAQRNISREEDVVGLIDFLIENDDARIVFLPMNHKIDTGVMSTIQKRLRTPDSAILLPEKYEPEEIAYLAGKMDLVISSRLHLLVLASVSHVPIVGISRGTKIDNFLSAFDEESVGEVEGFDPVKLRNNCERLLKDKAVFQEKAERVIDGMLKRLKKSEGLIRRYLA